jgi:hypothetical protein
MIALNTLPKMLDDIKLGIRKEKPWGENDVKYEIKLSVIV